MWKDLDAHVKKGLDFVKKVTAVAGGAVVTIPCPQSDSGGHLVFYHLRDELDDEEESAFLVPASCCLDVGTIKKYFPVNACEDLWLRFKLEDEDFGFVWIENLRDTDMAPTYRKSVHVQALRLPAPLPTSKLPPLREELIKQRLESKEAQIKAAREFVQSNASEEANRRANKVTAQNVLGPELDAWAFTEQGKFKDVRSLLSTMGSVLWLNSGWEEVNMGELMISAATVKKMYRKAIILTHPDRHQRESAEQQYRADRIFNAVNESYKVFAP